MDHSIKTAKAFLQTGLAFVFAYASIEIYLNPEGFLKYVPEFVRGLVGTTYFLTAFGIAELVLVIWLLSGWRLRAAAFVSFCVLFLITALNLEHFAVLFRNVAIAFAALALVMLGGKE